MQGRETVAVSTSRAVYYGSGVWACGVVLFFAAQIAFRPYSSGRMDAQLFFVIVFSGYTAAVLLVREAASRRAAFTLAGGLLAAFVLISLAFFYFPMGPGECQEWVDGAKQAHHHPAQQIHENGVGVGPRSGPERLILQQEQWS